MERMPYIIETNPKVLGGMPVIRGTRVPIARVLALVGQNYTLLELKKEIPHLSELKKKDLVQILNYYKNNFNS